MSTPENVLDPDDLTEAQMAHLREHLSRVLKLAESGRGFLRVEREGKQETLALPSSYLRVLARALAEVAEGRRVAIEPEEQELTTSEAADFLNVSRPNLTRLLKERKIPHRKVGTHRRVQLRDLRSYREAMRVEAADALQQLADQAQELGMGYEEYPCVHQSSPVDTFGVFVKIGGYARRKTAAFKKTQSELSVGTLPDQVPASPGRPIRISRATGNRPRVVARVRIR